MTELRPHLVLATCCLSLFLVTMDATIVNVALPAIRRDLHASVAGLQWSIDGHTVVVASFLMLSGSMADRFGRRRTFQLGLGVFSLGSLLCSLAASTNALVGFRMEQALGGSMLNPVAMSIVVSTFTDPKERARAIGILLSRFPYAVVFVEAHDLFKDEPELVDEIMAHARDMRAHSRMRPMP